MKTMMNCDNAFDALTSGPVELTASTSQDLVEHLEGCESCRALAEALRPATHLLHEALPDQDGLPLVLAEDDEAVLKVMRQVHTTTRPAAKGYVRPTAAAGLVTVACLLLVLMAPWWSRGNASSQDLRQQLSNFGLPQVCFQTADNHDVTSHLTSTNCNDCHIGTTSDELGDHCSLTLACCTTCHAATEPGSAPKVHVPQLLAACGSCHLPSH